MPLKKNLAAVLMAATTIVAAATQEQPTPYDLIRPVWPLTWDESVFDRYDTTVTTKHNMVPKKRTPASFLPNTFIPDTLNQAYLDAMNVKMSPIRVNQAGYMESDMERQFYYVGSATTFEIVDIDGNSLSPKVTGNFKSSGQSISSDWTIIAGTNAATNDQKRYQVDITGQSGMVQIGNIPTAGLATDTRYRIKVGNDISSTFIISNRVYSMVRSAALRFYGINRSGNGESWFHGPSHTLDGGGPVVTGADDVRGPFNQSLAGTLEGGYYDCGDHLKESQTQMYAFMVAAVMAAANPDADEDVYAYNQGETVNTDGIPDMLREAKHGADFVLRAYNRAKGVIDDMALSVGNFGSDHGWWGRPENQDKLPIDNSAAATDRGGPSSRTVRLGEIGANIGGETAAGLAILSKNYREFDAAFADSCLMVAEKMYDFAKALATGKSTYDGGKPFVNNKEAAGWSSPAYNGNNEYFDDMALASVALWYATGKKEYADDAIRSRTLGTTVPQSFMENCVGCFEGGWFVTDNKGFLKNHKNTSWANAYAYATYALYKLILADKNKALTEYGLTEKEWQDAIEDCVMSMIHNLNDVSAGTATITLPSKDPANYMVQSIGWKGNSVSYDPLWYSMQTDQTWIYNRYQAGNIFEVLAYADVAKDIQEKGIVLPNLGSPDWKADEMHQLGINQLNYLLGVNPWDVSYILGIGDKNDNHPHHRAANPEGKNQPGANYKYNPPVGALYGGVTPGLTNSMVPDNKSWEDYHKSETCIDAAATLVSSGALAAAKFDRTEAPKVNVEIRHVSMDSAIVMVKLSNRGTATIVYGTAEGSYTMTASDDEKGMQHEIILRGLDNGTTYYFYAIGVNAYVETNYTEKFMVDSTKAPYTFTTLNTVEAAEINNVTVCNLQGDSAEIMWYTPNGEYESKIYWDTVAHATPSEFAFNSGNRNADVSGLPTKFHYVKIGGLKEKTTYYYMVESNGVSTNVNDKGELLKFTTPVGWYDFSVRTYQYVFGGMDFLDANVYNNEARPFDSLTLRLYFTAKPEQVEKCATLIDSDICQAYDEAGFNKPCENDRELRDLLRAALPVRLDDTYNPKDGTYSYYFPAPLGSTTIKSQSRMRVDFGFSSGMSNDGYKTCETQRQPGKKRFTKESGDWSWSPHEFLVDGADYDGMPIEDKDYGDIDNEIAINQFITVYRKDEFIWGYSPSKQEMGTKRAHYEMSVEFDAPFNVSEGSYVELDQTSSTVYVKGHASITEQGYITKIWANGVQLKTTTQRIGDEILMYNTEGVIVAHYNVERGDGPIDSTGLWTLNIPVKMAIGSNKVDITLFAGPDPECEACSENGGCAFVNRNYYVQFSRGNMTASALTIKDMAGNPVASPADPNNTSFNIFLVDRDKANYSGALNVLVINNKKSDTLKVAMGEDPNSPGSFTSKFTVNAVSVAKNQRKGDQISFFAGDTIQVIYLDPDDDEDVSKQSFYAEATYPTPLKVLAQDTDCDNVADQLLVQFSSELDDNVQFQSIRFYINGMSDTMDVSLAGIKTSGERDVVIKIPAGIVIPETAAPTGVAELFLKADGEISKERLAISDGILPQLISVTLLENPDRQYPEDTLMVGFNEPVLLASNTVWPIEVQGVTGAVINVVGKATTSNNGKSWMFAVTGNTDGQILKEGAFVHMLANMATDNAFNALDPVSACYNVQIAETPRPVAITLAEMRDLQGDGYPDELYMKFEKQLREKDMLDSFVVVWGLNATTVSFKPSSWTHTVEEQTRDEEIIDKDSSSATYGQVIGTQPVTETVSVILIQMDATNGFPKGATSGPNDGIGGRVTPRLGPEGGFFDTHYSIVDKCPPIILSAIKENRGDNAYLSVKMSEPLNSSKDMLTSYIERKRTGNVPANAFLNPLGVIDADSRYTFSYKDDADDAIRVGDQIRLVYAGQDPAPRFSDKTGNFATDQNPWVSVSGNSSEKTRFIVTMNQNIGNEADVQPSMVPLQFQDYPFVLTVANSEGNRTYLENHNGSWSVGNVTSAMPTSFTSPVFNITVVIPSASLTGNTKPYFYDYEMNIAADVYDNLGQFINNQKIKINAASFNVLRNYINENGEIRLSLEWVAKDGEAPVSVDGRKIGTGPYIAKFDFKATSYCTETVDGKLRDDGLSCTQGVRKKETDSKTRTFGFKRSKRR
ncbi:MULTISPECIES: glycoside hydrolase family 9 protein [unclassified Fibrobacter]|uniref:glycoside hydrolase family 9 protein n=1 Tax=unclassified Fibrobacter TaxID=2634177 RepID=UPI000D6AAF3B|nr:MULTISPECIES: glycoside hydrolase family 9 protein [unclassified Fibrobacter]PWJ64423.1 glycosyl hydrolase family 9 [Fibrobacter sp. UWR4]PZW69300.1 glycosyl hydrolase family 9 [Fibrobacter sp. UWR1]